MKKIRLIILLSFYVAPLAFAEQSNQDENTNHAMEIGVSGATALSGTAATTTSLHLPLKKQQYEELEVRENDAIERERAAYKIRLSQEIGHEHIKRHFDAQKALGNKYKDFFSHDVISEQTQETLRKRYDLTEEEIKTATYDRTILDKTDRIRRNDNLRSYKKLNAGLWATFFTSLGATAILVSSKIQGTHTDGVEIDNSELLKDLSQDESLIAEKIEKEKRSPGALSL